MKLVFLLRSENNVYKSIFKIILIIWILSIPFKNAIFQGSIIFAIIFFLFYIFKTKNFNILFDNLKKTKNLFFGFSLIVLAMILSNLLNPEFLDKKSWHNIFSFVYKYGFMFIILAYFYRLDFFIMTLCSFSFLLLTGIYQIIQEPNIIIGEGIRGTLDNRNAFGLMMGMGFISSFYLLKDKKVFALPLLILFSFFMIFSFSRSSWVATNFSFIILLILHYKNIKISDIIYFLGFISFIILLYFNFDSFQHRFEQLLDGNSSHRTTIWIHTIELIKENSFFGYGLNSFRNLPDELLNKFPDPHNSILEILIYTGCFGLISCVLTIFVVLKKIYESKNFILFPISSYFIVVSQFDFGAFGSKELLSFLTIFVFFVYADSFRKIT
jgi:O-antigen ligase